MKKVEDIKYERADIPEAVRKVQTLTEKVKAVRSGSALAELRTAAMEISRGVSTAATLTEIRFAQCTADKFYFGEKSYYDEGLPHFNAECVEFERAFLASGHLPAALERINPNVAKVYELNIRTADARVSALTAEESKLETEYSMLMSGMTFRFERESVPLPVLMKYMNDEERGVRKKAAEALGKQLSRNAAALDRIFGELVRIRSQKARVTGISDFSVMGDMQFGRYSYGRAEIATYRARVISERVPEVAAAKTKIARELGIDRFMLYDNEVYFRRGNPEPAGGAGEIFAAARDMYADLGGETAEFFAFMESSGAFDVMPRKDKWGGGFCTNLDAYDQPFILANFNGSAGDVDVLTHEAGHALAFYRGARGNADQELMSAMTMSVSEVHSMAMEYFAYPYAGLFFGRADDYRRMHLESSAAFLPYGCMVDEFEETCYRNPDITPSERNALWLKLEGKYRPYLTADGIPYLERGTRWQYQSHIYESPMYYIDYCLAAEVALDFHRLAQADYKAAFAQYMDFMSHAGELPFQDLCKKIGIKCPI